MTRARLAGALIALASLACAAQAQQLYRWTDANGRVHVTDTPPPANARAMDTVKGASSTSASTEQMPYELAVAVKDYPVVLYTSPNCKEGCSRARAALNKRGVPFREVQVMDEQTNAELKRVSGGNDVPTLVVGRSVQQGFEQGAFDALLDAARYPKTGVLPPRNQSAPPPPAAQQAQAKPAAEPEEPRGPYSPGSAPPARRAPQAR
jgi:glutaredoxin